MVKKKLTIPYSEGMKSAVVYTAGAITPTRKSPDVALGELFSDVQNSNAYGDGKTFVDLIPKGRIAQIQKEYSLAKTDPNFDLHEFLARHFYEFNPHSAAVKEQFSDVREHISHLWEVLERRNRRNRGSLIALPHKYVVPGGRFGEQFYWDTYFVMLGLAADGRWRQIEYMMENYAYMIRKYGFIPTANRTYFLSRSQPPFFAQMVKLLATRRGKLRTYTLYLPYMLAEYRFWMKGSRLVKTDAEARGYARVVQMPDKSLMARYYDNKTTPRPESMREDIETADDEIDKNVLYLHLRAGAESGWDFSSRWFRDPHDIRTIHTTDIIPVDLNSLLYNLEMTIAESYTLLLQPLLAKRFLKKAEARKKAIQKYNWSDKHGFFMDYDYRARKDTGKKTLAAVFPLYVQAATPEQAGLVAKHIEESFLKDGGLVTTLEETGQQWDAPNGWAPLQWVAIQGLRNYGFNELADKIKARWIRTNTAVFEKDHKLVEKYDVVGSGLGGGGEYALQDGFGWTNGVLAALLSEEQ